MLIAFILCFPVLLVITALLNGANDFLVFMINMVVGGTILFVTFVLGERSDEKREKLHEDYLLEKKEREQQKKLLREFEDFDNNSNNNQDNINIGENLQDKENNDAKN